MILPRPTRLLPEIDASPVRPHDQAGPGAWIVIRLDFHTIPFHVEDAILEKHYVSKRSPRQKEILAFLAQDGHTHFFCYANTDLGKEQQDDEVLQFVKFWKERKGNFSEELVSDSKLTTYVKLNKLNRQGVQFITLRRSGFKLMEALDAEPPAHGDVSNGKVCRRIYRTPRILDQRVSLAGYARLI